MAIKLTVLCACLLFMNSPVLPRRGEQVAPQAAELVGTWVGEMTHDGKTTPLALEFEKRGNDVRGVLVVPAFHGQFPLGVTRLVDSKIETQALTFDFDRAARIISVTLPEGMLPRYRPRMTFRRSDKPFVLPERREPAMAQRQPVWTADLGAPLWADVAIAGDVVFVGADDGRLHAIEARTGRARWTFKAGGPIRARATVTGGDLFVPSDDGMLHRLDAGTGKVRWQVRVADKPAVRLPLSDPKSRYDHRAAAVAVAGDRLFVATYEGRVLALAKATGARVWEFKAGDSVATTPAVANGLVYVGSYDHFVYALNSTTGALAWKYDTGDAVTSDVAPAGTRVIVGSRSYDLESLDARSGAPQWKNYFWFSWVESSPTISGDTIFIGSSDAAKVFAIDLATGAPRWEADAFGSAWGRPAVNATSVFQGSAGVLRYSAPHRGVLLALDRASGAVKWWHEMPPPVPREPPPPELRAYGFAASVRSAPGSFSRLVWTAASTPSRSKPASAKIDRLSANACAIHARGARAGGTGGAGRGSAGRRGRGARRPR